MSFTNERGQYGSPRVHVPRVGVESKLPEASFTFKPWMLGGIGLAVVGLALVGTHTASKRPQLSEHEKEVRAWEREFPGLPWYMDQVKDSRQLDMWERARDHWERTRG